MPVSPSSVWLHGTKKSQTRSDRQAPRAHDLEFEYRAPTEDHAKEGSKLYSKEHCNEVHEVHRNGDALFSALRDEEGPKLRELIRTKERAPPTPTPPNGSRKGS